MKNLSNKDLKNINGGGIAYDIAWAIRYAILSGGSLQTNSSMAQTDFIANYQPL